MRRIFFHQSPQSPRPNFSSSNPPFEAGLQGAADEFDVQEYLWNEVDPDSSQIFEMDGATLYQPKSYVHSYAYPLILWLHNNGQSDAQAGQVIPKISDRNYMGAGLKGTFPELKNGSIGYRWSLVDDHVDQTLEEIYSLCMEIRSVWNIHTERIYLAGVGAGASVATQMVLKRPEWFGGLISIAPEPFEMVHPLAKFREMRHLQAMLIDDSNNQNPSDQWRSLFGSAGVKTLYNSYENASEMPQNLLQEMDRFLINSLAAAPTL